MCVYVFAQLFSCNILISSAFGKGSFAEGFLFMISRWVPVASSLSVRNTIITCACVQIVPMDVPTQSESFAMFHLKRIF